MCECECVSNRSLPALRTSVCAPLAVMVRSSRTTAYVAKNILLMLGPNGRKSIEMFVPILYLRSQNDEEDT